MRCQYCHLSGVSALYMVAWCIKRSVIPLVDMHNLDIGVRVQMRKKHPCGSDEWVVVRLGADIGLTCIGCNRRVLLSHADFSKRLKKVLSTHTDEQEGKRES